MIRRRTLVSALVLACFSALIVHAAGTLQSPEQFLGHKVGADNKLARWDKIVDYMKLAAANSDRVRFRELGKTSSGNPFIALEISAPDTLKNLDRYKRLEKKLYFQGGAPTDAERDEIFRQGKLVLLITCAIHATEIGASQMSLELVHHLATDDSPQVKKILDNVIFILVPSLNPDGQIMVTDWFNKNVGTPYAVEPDPVPLSPVRRPRQQPRHVHVHAEGEPVHRAAAVARLVSQRLARRASEGSNGARIFVMPATDPINANVHPLIYRWNGILGQSQAAALEAAGKEGIIYNSTYTNFWEGAMAWSGWWHNQIGLLTEVASARVAAPIEQQRAVPGRPAPPPAGGGRGEGGGRGQQFSDAPLPPPTDINPRTEYPRPWMGGRWTLRDIVDYELIATMALLETARIGGKRCCGRSTRSTGRPSRTGRRDRRRRFSSRSSGSRMRGKPPTSSTSSTSAAWRSIAPTRPFEADGNAYGAGTFVIPMTQVFARYAKDMLEKQTYPEVRRGPNAPPEPPYDVTAWSLGMLLGVETVFVKNPLPAMKMTKIEGSPKLPGDVTGTGTRFAFDYKGPDTAIAINRLLKDGARVSFDGPSHVAVDRRRAGQDRGRREGLRPFSDRRPSRKSQSRRTHEPNAERHAPSTRRGSRCISPGPAATWTKAGRAGCSSSTSSTSPRSTTPTSAPASCGRSSTPSSSRTRIRAPSSTASTRRRSARNIEAGLARPASSTSSSSSPKAAR